jgi:methionine sulfoxide reductase heme-binding subunit
MRDRLWYAVFLCALAPFLYGVYLAFTGGFGANPIKEATHFTGDWALRLLLLTLAITPLRRLTRRNAFARFRRMLGLYAFAYATLHFAAYLGLDLRGYWMQVFEDIAKRPYITVGFLSWFLLVPLAVTSTTGWIKRLGRNWARLHMLVYPVAVLAVLHFWWLVKSDLREPALYAAIAALLLGWRIWKRWKPRTFPSARA